jgi:hypothetical protein
MPYLAVIAPEIPAGHEAEFQAGMDQMIPQVKAQPGVLSTSLGPIVAVDGKPTHDSSKYIHTIGKTTANPANSFTQYQIRY